MTKAFLKFRTRINFISLLVLMSCGGLFIKFFQIQIIEGAKYKALGKRQVIVHQDIPAERGNIYDRKNNALTRNTTHYNLSVEPSKIQSKQALAEILSSCTGKSVDEYLYKLNSQKKFAYLERNIGRVLCPSLIDDPPSGLTIEKIIRRIYPHSDMASQIIGCTDLDDRGISGIEKKMDVLLKGTEGLALMQRNGRGQLFPNNNSPVKQPIQGSQIQLSIDLEYQCILQEELSVRMEVTGAIGATGIIMNPQNGEILAMASLPSFNPNHAGISNPEHQKAKAITDQFEPGSTFKIVAVAAALESQAISTDQEFNCENGSFVYNGLKINDHNEFGVLSVSDIISNSSNIGIVKISEIIGQNKLYQFARAFGFGSVTNVDLLGEISGTLRKTKDWSGISLATISMGHEVAVTALQLASAFSAIANGGFLIKPKIVNQVIDEFGNSKFYYEPEIIRKVASSSTVNSLTKMLVNAVERGTASGAKIQGWSVAGKTGTAQKFIKGNYSKNRFISNFVGFFPSNKPQILGLILLDEPKMGYHWGSEGAAPAFKKIMVRIINLDDSIKNTIELPTNKSAPLMSAKLEDETKDEKVHKDSLKNNQFISKSAFIVPDVRNMSMKKAGKTLRTLGFKTEIKGSGKVLWQSPKPGTNSKRGDFCTLELH